jgi:hypothetical protein
MHGNVVKDVYINGLNNEFHVANAFADHFESVFYNSGNNNSAKVDFANELARMPCAGRQSVSSIFSVKLIDSCIRKLKVGKAAGPDELSAEHLLNAHPSIVTLADH